MLAKRAILTFDDAVSNHATFVAPLLKHYGFGATFYIAEYPGPGDGTDRFATDKHQYMTWEQIRALDASGFEIGNHTGNHATMRDLDDATMSAELDLIETRCRARDIAPPTTFAYPCGHYDEAAIMLLRRRGYRLARTTENRPWDPATDDPLKIPGIVITDKNPDAFATALRSTETAMRTAGRLHIAVFTFHGIPDYNHPWVTFSPENFRAALKRLHDENWRVISLRDAL
jgi:peptidoglycan/xylan/chitin deacetylase (PgdA/CDA1 family)